MKICHTCRYWSPRLKGYCHRLEQGVGRFWICEEWLAGEEEKNAPEAGSRASNRD